MSETTDRRSTRPEDTEAAGEALARAIASVGEQRALVIGLRGDLGAGKTQWARGFVRGIDARFADWVSSPTYALLNSYPTNPPVHHLDLYRLSGEDDLEGIGFFELDDGHRIVEWSERIPSLRCDLVVSIQTVSPTERTISVRAVSPSGTRVVAALAA